MHWVLIISLIIFCIAELLLIRTFIVKKEKVALKSSTVSFGFLGLVLIAAFSFDFNMPDFAFILVIILFLVNSYFGYYQNLFNKSRKFDRFLHGYGSFSFAVFFYYLLSNFFQYGGSKAFQAFYIMLLGIFTGAVYEMIEFITDSKHEKKLQRGLRDTNFDMVSNFIGSIGASVLGFFILLP